MTQERRRSKGQRWQRRQIATTCDWGDTWLYMISKWIVSLSFFGFSLYKNMKYHISYFYISLLLSATTSKDSKPKGQCWCCCSWAQASSAQSNATGWNVGANLDLDAGNSRSSAIAATARLASSTCSPESSCDEFEGCCKGRCKASRWYSWRRIGIFWSWGGLLKQSFCFLIFLSVQVPL